MNMLSNINDISMHFIADASVSTAGLYSSQYSLIRTLYVVGSQSCGKMR